MKTPATSAVKEEIAADGSATDERLCAGLLTNDHLKANASPSGSAEPLPSRVTLSPTKTIRSAPGSADGGVLPAPSSGFSGSPPPFETVSLFSVGVLRTGGGGGEKRSTVGFVANRGTLRWGRPASAGFGAEFGAASGLEAGAVAEAAGSDGFLADSTKLAGAAWAIFCISGEAVAGESRETAKDRRGRSPSTTGGGLVGIASSARRAAAMFPP